VEELLVSVLKPVIGWNVSHQEFTIEDHYYFSDLKSTIIENGGSVSEVASLNDIFDYDVLVLNYPEKPFSGGDVGLIGEYLKTGKRVVVCGYYANEDRVAERVNTLVEGFGLRINRDCVKDSLSNDEGDALLVVTSRVLSFNGGVDRVLFPCSASIDLISPHATPLMIAEEGAGKAGEEKLLGARVQVDGGSVILLGTCVFWDNSAIKRYDNRAFSLNLLLG